MVTDDPTVGAAGARAQGGKQRHAARPGRVGRSRAVALLVALVVLALAAPLVVGAPSAWACSCPAATGQLSKLLPDNVVLEGRVVDESDLASGETVWTVQAARVFRGQATTMQPVVSPSDSASCGIEMRIGETYLVDATTDRDRPGVLRAGLCSATLPITELTAAERRENERLLGPGRPPSPGQTASPGQAASAAPVTTHGATVLVAVAVAAVGLLSVAGGLLLTRRRRAR